MAQARLSLSHSTPCIHAHSCSSSCPPSPPGWRVGAATRRSTTCPLFSRRNPGAFLPSATQDNRQPESPPAPHKQPAPGSPQPQAPDAAPSTPLWAQQLQQKWEALDAAQKGYTVAVGLLVLLALPKALTLLVLGLERVLIGGLLAVEEVLLQLVFRGGAVLGFAAVVALAIAGVYLFLVPKATK